MANLKPGPVATALIASAAFIGLVEYCAPPTAQSSEETAKADDTPRFLFNQVTYYSPVRQRADGSLEFNPSPSAEFVDPNTGRTFFKNCKALSKPDENLGQDQIRQAVKALNCRQPTIS